MNDKTKNKLSSFASDIDYLKAEGEWLRSHILRLVAEKKQRQLENDNTSIGGRVVGDVTYIEIDDLKRRVSSYREKEKELREELDLRIEAHRESGNFLLGLDSLCLSFNLSDKERLILLILTFSSMSSAVAEEILGDLAPLGRGYDLNYLASILEMSDMKSGLEFKKLFQHDSSLVKDDLLTIEYFSLTKTPEEFWLSSVSISASAFNLIVGDAE